MDRSTSFLSDDVYERLKRWLAENAFAPNTRLPGEHALSERFGVSRPTLRLAVARLCVEGLLKAHKGSGTFTQIVPIEVPDFVYPALANIPDVRSFLEFRCSVESELAGFAAERRTPQDIVLIDQAQRRLEDAMSAQEPGIDEDIALHAAIAAASGNRFYIATLASLTNQTRFSIRLTRELATRPKAGRIRDIRSEHAAICRAISDGDPAAARLAVTAHLKGGIERLFGKREMSAGEGHLPE